MRPDSRGQFILTCQSIYFSYIRTSIWKMDEGSKYFLAMLINKLQVSCKDRKVKDRVLHIFPFPDLEENYYSGGCVVISAVGVNQAHEVH